MAKVTKINKTRRADINVGDVVIYYEKIGIVTERTIYDDGVANYTIVDLESGQQTTKNSIEVELFHGEVRISNE